MSAEGPVLERWLAAAAQAYGGVIAAHAVGERDPFRNPIGHTLRIALTALTDEVLGGMDAAAIDAAFADIMALRSIQDLSVQEAVAFVFALRAILREEASGLGAREIEARVDRLALSAFAQYLACRERLAELKLNEQLRAIGVARLRAGRMQGARA